MIIRDETPDDTDAVRRVNAAAFSGPLEAQLVDALRAAGKAVISLVAVSARGEITGHVLFSRVHVAQGEKRGLGLGPVAVAPDHQGRGIGSHLIRAGLERATAHGYDFVVLLGSPAYYGRFGFKAASTFGLGNEYGVDEEFMALALHPDGLTGPAGTVTYEPEFAMFGA